MSWKEKLNITFSITTGDGATYTPLLAQSNTMSIDMLASSFEFSGIDGSLVKRKSTSGRSFPLVFFFTGDDHLDISDNFIESSKNKQPWTVVHPKYGDLYVQPLTIKRDDSSLNSSGFSVEVRETIKQSYPHASTSKKDSITTLSASTTSTAAGLFTAAVKSATTDDKAAFSDAITLVYEQYSQNIETSDDSTSLRNLYQKAISAVDVLGINTIQEFIQFPVDSASGISSKLSQLTTAYNQLTDLSTFSLKEYFQAIGASIISGMCLASIEPGDSDYSKRKDIVSTIDSIISVYNSYIESLDNAQDDNLSLAEAFSVDPEIISVTDRLVKETVANLNDVIFGAAVENTYTVQYPTNLIILSHMLLGKASPDNITELMAANDFTRDELIQIKKGREITYYV